MENLDTGKDKIKQICEILQNETLLPAKEEAQKILEVAQQEARNIIRDAEMQAQQMLKEASLKMNQEKELFDASIKQACRLGIESLRQDIDEKLFNQSFFDWVDKAGKEEQLLSQLVSALVEAIEKEGISADFSAMIPAKISSEKVNTLLAKKIVEKLREKSVVVGDFNGGVQVKLHDKRLTLDLSDEALKELIGQYIRKDFRAMLFQA